MSDGQKDWFPDSRVRGSENDFAEMAVRAAANSYSPYSGFPVGACLVWEPPGGEGVVTSVGCNVENAFYQCGHAEQAAVMSGAAQGYRRLLAAYVACIKPGPEAPLDLMMPCGFCRQWMSEFVPDGGDAEVIIVDRAGQPRARFRLIANLLPHPFRLEHS